jgi:hypothetical protein
VTNAKIVRLRLAPKSVGLSTSIAAANVGTDQSGLLEGRPRWSPGLAPAVYEALPW